MAGSSVRRFWIAGLLVTAALGAGLTAAAATAYGQSAPLKAAASARPPVRPAPAPTRSVAKAPAQPKAKAAPGGPVAAPRAARAAAVPLLQPQLAFAQCTQARAFPSDCPAAAMSPTIHTINLDGSGEVALAPFSSARPGETGPAYSPDG